MAPFNRKELRVKRENLYNLTGEVLFVYASDGRILMLVPEDMPLVWKAEMYLIAEGETLEKLSKDAKAKYYLLTTSSPGIGRNGKPTTQLVLYSDSSYRIFPNGY